MGRDDAKAIAGLQGGTAPARAFHDLMVRAVANRPVEKFETEVPMPDWELDPEEELWNPTGGNATDPLLDEYGQPYAGDPYIYDPEAQPSPPVPDSRYPGVPPADEQPDPYRQPPPGQQRPPPQPQPSSDPAADPFQPGSDTSQ
jgi:penicillin-binding protein 1A